MKKAELYLAAPVVVASLLLLNSWICSHLWMEGMVIAILILSSALFIGFVWKENVSDEREELHRHIASRFAYLSGVASLVIAIIIEAFQDRIDPWLVVVICIMILGKLFGLIYSRAKH